MHFDVRVRVKIELTNNVVNRVCLINKDTIFWKKKNKHT